MVSEEKIFKFHESLKTFEYGASIDTKGLIGRIYVGDH